MKKVWQWVLRHKVVSLMFLAVAGGLYYWLSAGSAATETRYILGTVKRGELTISVAGAGQVSAGTQIDVKPKVSGDITYLAVKEGQQVRAGTLLAQLDSTEAQKAIRDAEVNLESAQLSFDKLKQSTADIESILEDAFADISNAFLDFPTIVTGAEQIILGSTLSVGQSNTGFYKDFIGQLDDSNYQKIQLIVETAEADYRTARTDYDKAFLTYKGVTRYSSNAAIEDLLAQTLGTTKSIAQALKSEQNVLDFLTDYASSRSKAVPGLITTYKGNLRTYIGQANDHLSSLSTVSNTIANAPLDIRSQELSLKQRENSLLDAKAALTSYNVCAPFDAVVADLPLQKGSPASPSTIIATLITAKRIATISLNEVDVSKVVVGQPTALTFDALPELTMPGTVAQVETIGAVSQGVVTYDVEISFDTNDARVRPGMSVSATIITSATPDLLLVPSGAVKSQGGASYVEVLDQAGVKQRQPVEIGLSNDTLTEIKSGISEGDAIIVRTIAGTAVATPAQANGGFGGVRIPGVGGGGAVRTFTR